MNVIPVKSTYKIVQIVDIFKKEFFRLHGMHKVVISNKDVKFTFSFWKSLFTIFCTQIQFITSYHPQLDGKIERMNQFLEDMLIMHVMQ